MKWIMTNFWLRNFHFTMWKSLTVISYVQDSYTFQIHCNSQQHRLMILLNFNSLQFLNSFVHRRVFWTMQTLQLSFWNTIKTILTLFWNIHLYIFHVYEIYVLNIEILIYLILNMIYNINIKRSSFLTRLRIFRLEMVNYTSNRAFKSNSKRKKTLVKKTA